MADMHAAPSVPTRVNIAAIIATIVAGSIFITPPILFE
jgi:hypothetical protein